MNDPMGGDAPEITRAPARKQTAAATKKAAAKKKRKAGRQTTAAPQPRQQAEAISNVRRASPRPVPPRAEAARDTVRETPREGAIVAVGRDGSRLTRRRVASGDPLHLPMNEVPKGWSYQWNPVTVLNKPIGEIIQGDLKMFQNGWRAVPASRHAGRWTPVGYEGEIVVEGLRLEERPKSLTDEASAEDTQIARAQMRDRTDALRMTQKSLPGANVAARRGNAGGLKIDLDFGQDIPHPDHVVEGDAGFEE